MKWVRWNLEAKLTRCSHVWNSNHDPRKRQSINKVHKKGDTDQK
jgi:hypothetical protein